MSYGEPSNEGTSENLRHSNSFSFPLNNGSFGSFLRQYSAPQSVVSNFTNSVVREDVRPQISGRRIPLSTFFGAQHQNENVHVQPNSLADSVIINLENVQNNRVHNNNRSPSDNIVENNDNSADNIEGEPTDTLRHVLETHRTLQVFLRYVPFIFILLFKCFYDNGDQILNFVILLVTFSHCNNVLRKETAKQNRRNLLKLLLAVVYIMVCLLFLHFVQENNNIYYYMALIPPKELPSSVWDLLWTIAMADFVLKLLTIVVKICFASLPSVAIQFQKRGKYFLFLEAISQLYRSLLPIQLWLHFLLDFYHGAEKCVGVILSAAYMVSKGSDIVLKLKLLKEALFKLMRNVSLGSSPNKEQVLTAGNLCPICHDEYESPVLLTCKHIFCETCVTTWFDREQTCPLCRAKIVDDPSWRDGSTTFFVQLF